MNKTFTLSSVSEKDFNDAILALATANTIEEITKFSEIINEYNKAKKAAIRKQERMLRHMEAEEAKNELINERKDYRLSKKGTELCANAVKGMKITFYAGSGANLSIKTDFVFSKKKDCFYVERKNADDNHCLVHFIDVISVEPVAESIVA